MRGVPGLQGAEVNALAIRDDAALRVRLFPRRLPDEAPDRLDDALGGKVLVQALQQDPEVLGDVGGAALAALAPGGGILREGLPAGEDLGEEAGAGLALPRGRSCPGARRRGGRRRWRR